MTWDRRKTMRSAVKLVASTGDASRIVPHLFARTYGPDILPCEVEAETLKYQSEGGDK